MNWIMSVPVLCTSHMPTFDALERISEPVAKTEEGGFVYLSPEPEYLPDWLRPIQKWASERSFTWVRFESIGDVIDILPTFEWPELEEGNTAIQRLSTAFSESCVDAGSDI